jgi:hypothetical protein
MHDPPTEGNVTFSRVSDQQNMSIDKDTGDVLMAQNIALKKSVSGYTWSSTSPLPPLPRDGRLPPFPLSPLLPPRPAAGPPSPFAGLFQS